MKFDHADLKPMLATLVDDAFDDPAWVFEVKYDGYRLLVHAQKGVVTLYSRNTHDVTKTYEPIAAAFKKCPHDAIFDGELVVLDKKGISHFQLLQQATERPVPLYYYAFDILFLDGNDLRDKQLLERKKLLKRVLPKNVRLRYSDHVEEKGVAFFRAASREGLEGVIGKRAESRYFSGKRSRDWIKVKCGHEQEAIVIGYTDPKGSRTYFGSLVLAVHEAGKLTYVGHSGGGFDEQTRKKIYTALSKMKAKKPVQEKVPRERDVTWVKPKLIVQVKFTEWTADGHMRHPVYLGLRTDKPPSKVTRETPVKTV